mgnify:FL=1
MEAIATTTRASFDETDKYGKSKLEVFQLKSVGDSANLISSLTSKLTILVIVAFFSLFLTMGLCLYLGYFTFQLHNAFFVLASLFLLFGLILVVNKGEIIKEPMKYLIITSLLKEMNNPKMNNNKEADVY